MIAAPNRARQTAAPSAISTAVHVPVSRCAASACAAMTRERVAAMAADLGVELFIPPWSLCTDNAAMAGIALAKLAAGQVADLDIDVTAGLVRPGR